MKKSLSRILTLVLVLAMLISVVPMAFADEPSMSIDISGNTDLQLEDGQAATQLSINVPATPEKYGAPDIQWNTDGGTLNGNGATATFSATQAGDYHISVTVTFKPLETSDGENALQPIEYRGSTTITVKESVTAPVLVTSITIVGATVEVGKDVTLTATVLPEDAQNKNLLWTSSNPAVAVVDETTGKVTGVKAGEVRITATAQDGSEISGSCLVTVTDGFSVSAKGVSVAVGGSKTLLPSVTGVPAGKNVSYEFTSTNSNVTVAKNTGIVTGNAAGMASVHIKASYVDDNGVVKTAECDVQVSVYSQPTIAVTVKSGISSFTFDDTKVFSQVKYNGVSRSTWVDESMGSLLVEGVNTSGSWSIVFEESSSESSANSVGYLSRYQAASSSLYSVKFTQTNNRSGDFVVNFTIYDSESGLILSDGKLTITVGGSSGDITYETDYTTAVTFDEEDFEDFWNAVYPISTNTLKYVVFGVDGNTPKYGELYTTAAKSKVVSSTMRFYPNYNSTTNSGYYDLDTVTYAPSSSLKTAYTVEIPFTAYGGTGSNLTSLSGTVVIELNGSSSSITSRGVVFGNGTKSIADQMVADYKSETNTDLAYVVFDLPDVEDGRLYYNYSTILESARVTVKDDYYVSPSSKQLDLDKVAFIPAAGATGKVTIRYTGYDASGKNAYDGKIVLNISAKTKSDKFTDVTASSYAWAADSVDFLYYESVVQGSGSKYNPASSITRGDFMIMLYRAFLEADYKNYTVTSNFADVKKGTDSYSQETYQAVGVAKYLGIAKGDGTNFKPTSSITREEAMTLIYRTLDQIDLDLEYTSSNTTRSFTDYSTVSTYAQDSITYLIRHGIVVGSNGKISPKSNITRAEMAVILHRVLTY